MLILTKKKKDNKEQVKTEIPTNNDDGTLQVNVSISYKNGGTDWKDLSLTDNNDPLEEMDDESIVAPEGSPEVPVLTNDVSIGNAPPEISTQVSEPDNLPLEEPPVEEQILDEAQAESVPSDCDSASIVIG